MDRRKVILLVGALVIALGTAVMARMLFMGGTTPTVEALPIAQEEEGTRVLVSNRSLPVGTIITPESFSFQPWPDELVENVYFLEEEVDASSLFGTVVRHPITAGQPVTQGALVSPGDRGFLAAALGPGMRAVTVPVSARTGVAGFVFPGDRVDLMLTQSVSAGNDESLRTAETIIRNLRVLATDQRVNAGNADGNTVVRTFSTVTVEATPRIAEKIAVSQTIGTLSLSLRSIADNEAELERAIAAGDIDLPEGDDPVAEEQALRRIAARPDDSNTTFVTGGDVSRFQSRTLPAAGSGNATAGSTTPEILRGPVVRVARGNSVTEVPVGGN